MEVFLNLAIRGWASSRMEGFLSFAQVMVQCLQRLEGRVVSVVGLAHLDGMQSRWDAWQKRSRQLS